jgi:hypothetical protein
MGLGSSQASANSEEQNAHSGNLVFIGCGPFRPPFSPSLANARLQLRGWLAGACRGTTFYLSAERLPTRRAVLLCIPIAWESCPRGEKEAKNRALKLGTKKGWALRLPAQGGASEGLKALWA